MITGKVKGHKNGVNIIKGDDGSVYYNYGPRIQLGEEVGYIESEDDPDIAVDIHPISSQEYSLRELVAVMLIGMVIGAALSFMTASKVFGAPISEADKALMVQIVHAEAGNQDLLGRRLVADVVLNRVDNEAFPDTVYEVIYQPGQFTPVRTGSINLPADDMDMLAVELELQQRTSDSVLFFRRGRYADYGEPHFKVGDHYFS